MKKLLFLILILALILCGCGKSINSMSNNELSSKYNNINTGEDIKEVEKELGNNDVAVFTDGKQDYYDWIDLKKGEKHLELTVKDGKVSKKEYVKD